MDSESGCLPLDYLQGHKDGLEWASQLAEANHPETGDWLYDDPIELANAIRKGPDIPPAQPAADSEPVAWTWHYREQWHVTNDSRRAEFVAKDGDVAVLPLYRHAQPVPVVPYDFDFDRFNDVVWLECVASNPHMHSPTTSTIARVALELNKRIGAGNSPAQSDCCPAQNHVSPEQNGDTPAQSEGWIQVSERMPPSRHEVLVGRWWGEKPLWCCKWATYIPGHPDAQSSGWLIPGASWTPTHWMPLPAAPQEVKSE
ncbi:DUF551 domain-containing protein [Klebsiella pneumoniae]